MSRAVISATFPATAVGAVRSLPAGILRSSVATVSLTQVREISELVKPSLACLVEHPFGLTLGGASLHPGYGAVAVNNWTVN